MQKTDRLYRETLLRVGPDNMEGVDRLLSDGHTGIAESKTVEKLLIYIRGLEKQLGIDVPAGERDINPENMIKITLKGVSHYVSR